MTILHRTFATDLHVREDDRIIAGTLVPYGAPTQVTEYGRTYTEDFAPHAFAADVRSGQRDRADRAAPALR